MTMEPFSLHFTVKLMQPDDDAGHRTLCRGLENAMPRRGKPRTFRKPWPLPLGMAFTPNVLKNPNEAVKHCNFVMVFWNRRAHVNGLIVLEPIVLSKPIIDHDLHLRVVLRSTKPFEPAIV